MSEHFLFYLDALLRLQSQAVEEYNHKGVLGSVREEFVIQVLQDRIDDIKLHKGEVVLSNGGEAGQQDIIIRRTGSLNPVLGGQVRINACDCAGVIEIKSNAKATEITSFDKKAALIKADNPNAICGMVCYKLANKKETILKRMGFAFDPDLEAFQVNEGAELEYNDIDFILCLDEDPEVTLSSEYTKCFFVQRGTNGRYSLFLNPPYVKHFLMAVNAIVNQAGTHE